MGRQIGGFFFSQGIRLFEDKTFFAGGHLGERSMGSEHLYFFQTDQIVPSLTRS